VKHLLDLVRVRIRLAQFYELTDVNRWLHRPHPQLGGQRAIDVIAAGRAAEVEAVIDRLESGAFT